MNPIVKAAAVQISPVLYSRQGTVEKIVKKIRELLRHPNVLSHSDGKFAGAPEGAPQ